MKKIFVCLLTLSMMLSACASAVERGAGTPLDLVDAEGLNGAEMVIISVPLTKQSQTLAFAEAFIARHGGEIVTGWPLAAVDLYCLVLQVPAGMTPERYIERVLDDDRVRTASRINAYETLAIPAYRDELVPAQHGLVSINALATHAYVRGRGIRVAVIDTGVSPQHPDLRNRLVLWRDFVASEAIDPLGEPHGTAVAAVIAADSENASGMVGVAPEADLLGLRACWESEAGGRCNSFSLARALNFAIAQNADVINLSLAGAPDPLLSELISQATMQGVLVVGARGNTRTPRFPASHPGVLPASQDSRGDAFTLPGKDIVSARATGEYDFFSGDSIAAAHLSGVLALMKTAERQLDQKAATQALIAARPGPQNTVDSCKAVRMISDLACD